MNLNNFCARKLTKIIDYNANIGSHGMYSIYFRGGHPPGQGLWLRVRDRVPGATGGRVPHRPQHRPRRPVQEERANPCFQVSKFSVI